MPKRRLLWHVFPSYGLLALLSVLVAGWIATNELERSQLATVRAELQAFSDFFDRQLGSEAPDDLRGLARLCRDYDRASGVRIALLLPDGKVDFDSRGRSEELENQLGRPEIESAFGGRAQDIVRYIPALGVRVIDAALPIFRHDKIWGVLHLSAPLARLDRAVEQLRTRLIVGGLLMVACSMALAWWMSRNVARPLDQLRQAAAQLSAGRWETRVAIPDQEELAEVAETFNRMAEGLQERIGVMIQSTSEQRAVLASMAEGVLAVDSQERVISLNIALARLLGLDPELAKGRRLHEVVRNAELSRFVSRALAGQEPIAAEIVLHGDRQRVMQAHGSGLHDLQGRAIGAVIVLNDVTDFRRLEQIRRDFVANVSHELKTPVTSIKGFVETLLDGAMQDPVDSQRFLQIVAKQADRLHAIIEDLLSLSKIEQSEDAQDIVLEAGAIRPVIESAVNACQTAAEERHIEVLFECDDRLRARINTVLLEQAVVNLLDNAIKYSEPGRQVRVAVAETNGEITLSVVDHGSGIASEHWARIFERFYRVDRARSRKMGGTGLGLAIVKHIVQAHHGRVSVESALGVGSTFTIHLLRA